LQTLRYNDVTAADKADHTIRAIFIATAETGPALKQILFATLIIN
jgi:hypothetical protein